MRRRLPAPAPTMQDAGRHAVSEVWSKSRIQSTSTEVGEVMSLWRSGTTVACVGPQTARGDWPAGLGLLELGNLPLSRIATCFLGSAMPPGADSGDRSCSSTRADSSRFFAIVFWASVSSGVRGGPSNKLKGTSKLSEDQQAEALRRLAAGESCRAIARTFHVRHSTISRLASRRRA